MWRNQNIHGEAILNSGAKEVHQRGVEIIIDTETQESLMKWNPMNDTIISASFYSRFVKKQLCNYIAQNMMQMMKKKTRSMNNLRRRQTQHQYMAYSPRWFMK